MTKVKHKHVDSNAQTRFWARRNVLVVAGIAAVFVVLAVPAIGAMATGVTP